MPIYEYRCSDCERQFETMQRISDPPLTTCETCGGKLDKLVSAPAFQFKGTGWYVTDYANSGKKDEAAAESGSKDAKKEGDSKSGAGEKKGDAKKETKTETKQKSET